MLDQFRDHPGRLYVVAALLPAVPALLTLLAATAKNLARPAAAKGGFAAWVYLALGGGKPQAWGAYLSVACVALSAALSLLGLMNFVMDDPAARQELILSGVVSSSSQCVPLDDVLTSPYFASRLAFAEEADWVRLTSVNPDTAPRWTSNHARVLRVTYYVDWTTALVFTMVTTVSTLVMAFSLGYMDDERRAKLEDHEAHLKRRGRFGLFFAYLAMFVSAMLNLLIAANLFQLFVCWELVGASSFLLIGFYSERGYAGVAASKAFVVNRVGDAGFLIAIAMAWAAFGALDLWSLRYETPELGWMKLDFKEIPRWADPAIFDAANNWFWTIFGLGLFLGCVGKSAQVPLHVWLPDAMAGPTPVSALIHAATMVAAGVYLAARCSFLFAPDVLTVIAYTGAGTAFLAATAACVQTDIKKGLAYSTCSQLGLMMLAVGLGQPSVALFHLLTHAFFKALLFLGAGSVIHGLHHKQDLRRMGGLRRKMPTTALTMLVGVLAISGFPLLSGWYSKGLILGAAWEHAEKHAADAALFALPMLTAGLTAFYMFRLWFLTFAGEPRDHEAFDHAHESPPVMTVPLVVLAGFSVAVGWGWPAWDAHASYLYRLLDPHPHGDGGSHVALEIAAGLVAAAGFAAAFWMYRVRGVVPSEPRGIRTFFARAWYFDALYRAAVVQPTLWLSRQLASADRRPGTADGDGSDPVATKPDPGTLDGLLTLPAVLAAAVGQRLRRVQEGHVRGYVLALGLTVAGLLGMLATLSR